MKPRAGVKILTDHPGSGEIVQRLGWYQVDLRMWLRRGDPVRWTRPWGTSPATLSESGELLSTCVRIDRGSLFAGLRYGVEGMRVGGKRKLEIAPHLAFGKEGVPGVIPPDALLVVEIEFKAEGLPE